MKSGVVEGEPGIFPDPIARVLRAIGRFLTTRRDASEPTEDLETDNPPEDRQR
jgi:hypothetical protein